MTTYLVGFAVIHRHGHSVSRAFLDLPRGELVTVQVVMRWEHGLAAEYDELGRGLAIRVFSFQPMNGE